MTFKTVYRVHIQSKGKVIGINWLGDLDSNREFSESESDVLPLNYPPTTRNWARDSLPCVL